MRTLRIHYVHTAGTLHIHFVYKLYEIRAVHTPCMNYVYIISAVCMRSVRAVHTRYVTPYVQCVLCKHCGHSVCAMYTVSVRYVDTTCTLSRCDGRRT